MDFALFLLLVINGVFSAPMSNSNGQDTTVSTEWCGGKPADIFFLLDSSSSIWIYDYKKQLQFISDVVDIFEISSEQTRIAVSAFSHFYRPFIHFDSYDNKKDLQKAIKKVPYLRGQTYTGKALERMATSGFAKARTGVAHIAIVLTDGVSANKDETKKEAENLKKKGIYIFSVGIGNKVDKEELRAIGSEPSDDFVYDVASFDMLKTIRETLAFKACNVEPVTTEAPLQMDHPACGLREKADMMFCFDSAASGTQRSRIVYKFITELTDEFNMDDSSIRVGVASRNCHEHDIHLNDYIQKDALLDAINSIEYRGLAPVIHNMRKHAFSESHGGRAEAKKIAVLFVDEDTDKLEFVIQEAEEAKKQGIEVYVVSIGQVDISALRKIASEPVGNHVIKVSSYKDIPMLKEDFINSVCQDL